jgi:protein transport protein SEC24
MYRKYCSSNSSPGQLVLPEALKTLPVFTLALLKCKAFRLTGDVTTDVRIFNIRMIKNISMRFLVNYLYPKLYPLHFLPEEMGQYNNEKKRINLPSNIRLSYDRLDVNGIYLLENDMNLYLWIGRDVSVEYLMNIFGVDSLDKIDVKMVRRF